MVMGLREFKLWLSEVVLSLPDLKPFISTYMKRSSTRTARHCLKLLASMHLSGSSVFISLRWEDLPRSLPTLEEEDEQSFLNIMLTKLISKFALQLDPDPNVDRSCQLAFDFPDEESIFFSSQSSHSRVYG
jgi:hypothetical protein